MRPPGHPAGAPTVPSLPPLLPLSLSPRWWHGDIAVHSCADERQARGLQVTLLGSGAGGWAAGLAAACPGEPAPRSPAWLPATVPGEFCPRCCGCCAEASSCSPARPQPLCPPLFLSEFQGIARHFLARDIFRPVDVTTVLGPARRSRPERTNRHCRPMGTAPYPQPGSAPQGG